MYVCKFVVYICRETDRQIDRDRQESKLTEIRLSGVQVIERVN